MESIYSKALQSAFNKTERGLTFFPGNFQIFQNSFPWEHLRIFLQMTTDWWKLVKMKLFCYSLMKIQIYKGDKDIWIGEESLLRFTELCFIEKSTELLLKFTSNTKLLLLKTIYLRHRLIYFFYFIGKSWSVLELFSFVSMFNLTYSSPFYFTNQLQLPSKQLWTVYSFPVFWDGLLRWLKMEHLNYFVALWCSGYHYCTTSFNKAWTQVLHRFKSCLWRVRDLRW